MQEPPGKLLHHMMASKHALVISTVIDNEDVSFLKCLLSEYERASVRSTAIDDKDSSVLKRPSSESLPLSRDPSEQPCVSSSQTEAPAVEFSTDTKNHADAATAQVKAASANDEKKRHDVRMFRNLSRK